MGILKQGLQVLFSWDNFLVLLEVHLEVLFLINLTYGMLGRWGDWIYYNLSQGDMHAKQLLLNDYTWLSITNPYEVKTNKQT